MYHFRVLAALHELNEVGVAVDFHHNHDALVALLGLHRELTCLIGEHGFVYLVCLGVDVSNFLTLKSVGVVCFQRRCFFFGGAHILSCLIQMLSCSFDCLRVVLLDIAFSQHRPAHILARLDGFEPIQF